MSIKKISFENSWGANLSANLELPFNRSAHNFAIFAHCFTCNKNFAAVKHISSALAEKGFGVLSFDFTGLGESDGEFSDSNFSSSVDDLIAAAEFLRKNYQAPTIMIGHSLGGAASLLAAAKLDEIKAVATIGSPSDPRHVGSLITSSLTEIIERGSASVSIGGRPFLIKKQLIEDLENQTLIAAVRKMRKACLFMHSPQDKIVDIDHASDLYKAAFHPKSFISLDGADHLLSNKADASFVGNVIASWASRYSEIPVDKEVSTQRQIVAYLGSEEKFTTRIMAGEHQIIADEPKSFGGNAYGFSPYQLVAAGLAACTAMTLHLYAERKKWQLKETYVHISHEKSHAEDCLNCESTMSKIDKFVREIELVGDLDEEQRQRLLEIADKCPVHRTLENEAQILTTLRT